MDGDLGPLPALCDVAEEFGAIMMVDDAHASGVFGRTAAAPSITSACTARGRAGRHALEGHRRAGRLRSRDREASSIFSTSRRPFLFSTSHPPSVAARAAALDLLEQDRHSSNVCGRTLVSSKQTRGARLQNGIERSPISR
jgi:glycine C-acetyltransferase